MAPLCPESRASLLLDGRECSVHPFRGSALGRASGVVVRIGNDASLDGATGWMPGRIAVVTVAALTTDTLRHLVGHHHGEEPFAGVVILVDERDDLSRLGGVEAGVPVVVSGRSADRVWLQRAVHADLWVHVPGQPSLAAPVRPRRERHDAVRFGEPGTVRFHPSGAPTTH